VAEKTENSWWLPTDEIREAAARCLHLLERQSGCGVLCGDAGCGKTVVLKRLARKATRCARRVCYIDLAGIDAAEFQWRLCAGLRLAPSLADESIQIWTRLTDALHGADASGMGAAILFDHADAATPAVLPHLRRWLHLAESQRQMVSILATRLPIPASLSELIADFCDIRADLHKLTLEQTAQFVQNWSESECGPPALADAATAGALHELTSGEPRKLERLCRLATLASAAENGRPLDRSALESLMTELTGLRSARRAGIVPRP
jgi:type II secretory pathway predicted ATPase ExeA